MIELSDDKARLDLSQVHAWLTTSYWTPGISRAQVEKGIAGSLCLGAYDGERQVGFARAITDYASFAWIADVWVDEPVRGQGLGRRMVQWMLDHRDLKDIRRIALGTADAHGVYAALGFHPLLRPERFMERLSPTYAAFLRDGAP